MLLLELVVSDLTTEQNYLERNNFTYSSCLNTEYTINSIESSTNLTISPCQAMLNIIVSVLNKEFEVPPYSQSVELGSQVEMRCHPPSGQPKPKVSHSPPPSCGETGH